MSFSAASVARVKARMLARHARTQRQLLPRMREPSDLAYRTALLGVARAAQKAIRADLESLLKAHTDNTRTDGASDELRALFKRLRVQTSVAVAKIAPALAKRFVVDAEKANRTAMNAQFRTVLKIDPFTSNQGLARTMQARARANVELIKSIPEQLLDQVEEVVTPRVAGGIRFEEIMKSVQERFNVSESRAQLIARDQVGKFNGQLARERQSALGINTYVWSTSKDTRVRADHAELEGRVCSYDDPPVVDSRTGMTANPGEDYQCRCQPLPQVNAVLDALGIGDEDIDVVDDDT